MRYIALFSTGLALTGCCIPPEPLPVDGAPGHQVKVYAHPGATIVDAAVRPEELHAEARDLRDMGQVAKATSVENLAKVASELDLGINPAKTCSESVCRPVSSGAGRLGWGARPFRRASSLVLDDCSLLEMGMTSPSAGQAPAEFQRSALTPTSGARPALAPAEFMRMQRQLAWIEADIANTSSAITNLRAQESALQTQIAPSLIDEDRSIADMDYTTVGPFSPQGLPVNRDRMDDVITGVLPGTTGLPLPSDVANAAAMNRESGQVSQDISSLQAHLSGLQAQRSRLRSALGL